MSKCVRTAEGRARKQLWISRKNAAGSEVGSDFESGAESGISDWDSDMEPGEKRRKIGSPRTPAGQKHKMGELISRKGVLSFLEQINIGDWSVTRYQERL